VARTTGTSQTVAAPRILYDAHAYPQWLRWLGVLTLTFGLAIALAGERADDHGLLAVALASAAIGRGVGLRRPLLLGHLVGALVVLLLAGVAIHEGEPEFAQAGLALAGVFAFWSPPGPPPGSTQDRRRVGALVNASVGDPLAPFALRQDKSYVFSPDGLAAMAYRVRFGVAVVSGDPVGAPGSLESAAEAMLALVADNAWRLGVLGASEAWSGWWKARGCRAVPIGRDVVIDVETFAMAGRSFRNLRQAVQRTRNAGVTTAVYDESALPADLREQLRAIVLASHRSERRGFSMIMDRLLEVDQQAGTLVAVAFDSDGRPVAFQRFGVAGGGRDVSQDLPWRSPGAPNGVDERLAHDTVAWARAQGASRLSLSFAAFPELYETAPSGALAKLSYWATHRLDRYIRLESLYRYLRKFHALGERRFVMLRLREVVPVAAAMLTLEFNAFRGESAWWRRRWFDRSVRR
jgi:lysylphosphatidylglycerol synthetase-like protein (DUF2156 family)